MSGFKVEQTVKNASGELKTKCEQRKLEIQITFKLYWGNPVAKVKYTKKIFVLKQDGNK